MLRPEFLSGVCSFLSSPEANHLTISAGCLPSNPPAHSHPTDTWLLISFSQKREVDRGQRPEDGGGACISKQILVIGWVLLLSAYQAALTQRFLLWVLTASLAASDWSRVAAPRSCFPLLYCPGQFGLVDRASACGFKGRRIDSDRGHIPWL